MFLYIGVLRFFDRRERRRPLIAFLAVYALVTIYFTYVNDDIVFRRAVFYVADAALSFLTTRALLIYRHRSVSASTNFLAAVFLAHGFVLMVSMLINGYSPPDAGLLTASPVQVGTYLDGLIVTSLWTFGFIILVNQRLNSENREAKENLELIFNTSPDAVLLTRLTDGFFVLINDGFTALTGYTRADVIGRSSLDIQLWKDPADRQKLTTALNEKGFCENLEAVFQRKDGSQIIGMVSAKLLPLQGVPHLISVTRDITERKHLEDKLHQQATMDELTGIWNRRHFLELADREIKRAIRLNHPLSIALIDLDHFKQVNDTYGHMAGDQVLVAFAKICQKNIREIDLHARIGGDEFAMLLPEANCDQAYEVVERVCRALVPLPMDQDGRLVAITISAGIASSQGEQESLDALMGRADQALYRAKEAGRNRVEMDLASI